MSEKTYRANEVVSCAEEDEDGALLYNPDKDESVLLNPSGRIVWSLLSVPRTLDEIAVQLVTAYPEVPRDEALEDARQFIQPLVPDFVIPSSC